jgi:hypothetical protein
MQRKRESGWSEKPLNVGRRNEQRCIQNRLEYLLGRSKPSESLAPTFEACR